MKVETKVIVDGKEPDNEDVQVETPGVGRIILQGLCDEEILENVTLPLLDFREDPSINKVELLVHSNGGYMLESLYLLDIIENYPKPLDIIITKAMSMAFIIAISGKNNKNVRRYAYPNSILLMHRGEITIDGSASAASDFIGFSSDLEKITKKHILKNSTMSSEEYDKIWKNEFYMTGAQALKYHFIDKLLV